MENDNRNLETKVKTKTKQYSIDASDILQPSWVRCALQMGYGYDRFLLDYGRNILPYISATIYIILLLI
jgi:hypothetical protein